MPRLFRNVGGLRPGRSAFNLSYEKKMTADVGYLYPIMCDVMVPGDIWQIGANIVVRAAPLMAPILHEVNVHVHYFFVPCRLLESDWEDFISGGEDGASAATISTWSPSDVTSDSLWAYCFGCHGQTPDADNRPLALPKLAYNTIYNEFYRDEHLTTAVNVSTSESLLKRCWEKDYFTSARPWQVLGTPAALPITGSVTWANTGGSSDGNMVYNSSDDLPPAGSVTRDTLNNNTLAATSFGMADLRYTAQIQKWMERNARAGVRYTEFLRSHFGVSPSDARLDRPEFIGGVKVPIVISEVLQTSSQSLALEGGETKTPLGELGGHGITADSQRIGSYRAEEFGVIMGLLSIMPRPAYQQGINRQWFATTKYDWYFPEFAHLSEQAILRREIYINNTKADNETVFGYQGRYDEHRYKPNMLGGLMFENEGFDAWHMARYFASAPTLVTSFVECDEAVTDNCLAAPSEPGFFVSIGNMIRAIRPMPIMAEPGGV